MRKNHRQPTYCARTFERPWAVSVQEARLLCGIGKTSIYKCLAKGELKRATGTSLKRCLITMASIDTFLGANLEPAND